jgi:hypothetical protein
MKFNLYNILCGFSFHMDLSEPGRDILPVNDEKMLIGARNSNKIQILVYQTIYFVSFSSKKLSEVRISSLLLLNPSMFLINKHNKNCVKSLRARRKKPPNHKSITVDIYLATPIPKSWDSQVVRPNIINHEIVFLFLQHTINNLVCQIHPRVGELSPKLIRFIGKKN